MAHGIREGAATGRRIGYVADSSVFHIHEETWSRVKTRYEREAIALRSIMPARVRTARTSASREL